jgi:hypothetical protein
MSCIQSRTARTAAWLSLAFAMAGSRYGTSPVTYFLPRLARPLWATKQEWIR